MDEITTLLTIVAAMLEAGDRANPGTVDDPSTGVQDPEYYVSRAADLFEEAREVADNIKSREIVASPKSNAGA